MRLGREFRQLLGNNGPGNSGLGNSRLGLCGPRPALTHRSLALASLCVVAASACGAEPPPAGAPVSETPTAGAPAASDEAQLKVGNPSPTGMDTIPDWNQLAAELKGRMDPRLPTPLPTDDEKACKDMLAEAKRFYEATEINPEFQAQRRAEFDATYVSDLETCRKSTSVAAAICVKLLLNEHSAEFPWLLDQCSRAYPKP